MRPRKPMIPTWAKRERESDISWIMENHHIFWPHAQEQYQQSGRGAIIVNTLSQPLGAGHPFTYLTQAAVTENCDQDVQRMVKQYHPETEMVVVLLKSNDRMSSYRLMNVGHG